MSETSVLPKGAASFNYPREYDLVVRVDNISTIESIEKAKKVMTGGKQAETKASIRQDETTGGVGMREEYTEPTKCIRVSDTA